MERLTKFVIIALSLTILSLFIPTLDLCTLVVDDGLPASPFSTDLGKRCMLLTGTFTLNPLFYFFIGPSIILNSSFIICKLIKVFYKKKFNFKKIFPYTVLISSIVMAVVMLNSPIPLTLTSSTYLNDPYVFYSYNPDLFPENLIFEIGNHFLFYDDVNFDCIEKPLSISQMCNAIDHDGWFKYKITTTLLSSYLGLEPNIVKIDESIGSKIDPASFKKLIDVTPNRTIEHFKNNR